MTPCFFASDLHGNPELYEKLFDAIEDEPPRAVFLGGDLLSPGLIPLMSDKAYQDFIGDLMVPGFKRLQKTLGESYPRVFLIFGNDDARSQEPDILQAAKLGIWEYVHNRKSGFGKFSMYGYGCVPPTPFQLKDWERYDVSRFVDPGCLSPETGIRSVPVSASEIRYGTIQNDLALLAGDDDLRQAVFLFHTPPYQTCLDRAALDGRTIDHVPLDVHVGSIAVKRFIEVRQPLVTLHGHIHESARLTGSWREKIGRTFAFSAAHDGPELALVRFLPENPEAATRELI